MNKKGNSRHPISQLELIIHNLFRGDLKWTQMDSMVIRSPVGLVISTQQREIQIPEKQRNKLSIEFVGIKLSYKNYILLYFIALGTSI